MQMYVLQPLAQWLSGRVSALWLGGCGFDPRPGHTKDFKNGTSCSFAWRSALRKRARTGQLSVSIMWLGGISCQSVSGVIFQWGSTLKVSIELPATSRHCHDTTERLLKGTLSPNQTNKQMCYNQGSWLGFIEQWLKVGRIWRNQWHFGWFLVC